MTSLNPATSRVSVSAGLLPSPPAAGTTTTRSHVDPPVAPGRRTRAPRTWEWSRLALGATGLSAVATVVGATNVLHSKVVDTLVGPTEFWAAATLLLLLATFWVMPLHVLNRLALAALVVGPTAAGFMAVRPHLSPREQLELVTGKTGLDAVALTDSTGDRVAIRTQGDRAPWTSDLTSPVHTVACMATPSTTQQLARLTWGTPTTLVVQRADGRSATITVDSSGEALAVSDPRDILRPTGHFGC